MIKNIFQQYSTCSECSTKLTFFHYESIRNGFSIGILIQCSNCDFESIFYSSPSINRSVSGSKPYQINLRDVMAFREIGRVRQAIFNAIMNMPPHSYESQLQSYK